jgi:NAD(P)-dependent dehydrogenase (short-subunit alcohol dehydrogenase family)
MRLLAGRVAVVTGGARGLGAAIARHLAEAGAAVTVLDLPDCDVTQEAPLAAALARLPRIDLLVANAGIVPPWRAVEALDLDEWDRVLAVNLRGAAASMKHAAPRMVSGGAILAMASINSEQAAPAQALYTASKHGVLGLVRAAALDLGPRGIRVNALAPGPIATAALRERLAARHAAGGMAPEAALAAEAARTPLGRIATEREVADAALFLLSDMASAITGRMLRVDGGLA